MKRAGIAAAVVAAACTFGLAGIAGATEVEVAYDKKSDTTTVSVCTEVLSVTRPALDPIEVEIGDLSIIGVLVIHGTSDEEAVFGPLPGDELSAKSGKSCEGTHNGN